MLPALSWPAPATVPQADASMPAPRMATIARARFTPRSLSRSVIRTPYDLFDQNQITLFIMLRFAYFYGNQILDVFGKYLCRR